jgi:type IV pilus assembly protein PilM
MEQLLDNYFRFVKRFLPDEKGITKVGLDIGVNSCKFIALAKMGDKYEIQAWGIEPIETGGLVQCLKTIAAKYSLPNKSPVSSVSGKGTLIRYIDMPRMSLDDLKKSFSIEVDKYFPFDQNSIYTDCSILDPKSKDKKMAVLIAAVKKEMVDERVQALLGAGLEPQQVTINAIAVANAFQILGSGEKVAEVSDKSKNHAKAILDIGDSVSNLMILKDGVPRFTRDIFIGSQEITKRIMNTFGLSAEEAEKLKRSPGEQAENVFNTCESTIMNWISEIRLSLDYFITEKNIQVDQLFLTGGGSMMQNLETLFEKNLDLTVRKWDLLSDLSFAPNAAKEEIAKHAPRLSVAIGLALSQYD